MIVTIAHLSFECYHPLYPNLRYRTGERICQLHFVKEIVERNRAKTPLKSFYIIQLNYTKHRAWLPQSRSYDLFKVDTCYQSNFMKEYIIHNIITFWRVRSNQG